MTSSPADSNAELGLGRSSFSTVEEESGKQLFVSAFFWSVPGFEEHLLMHSFIDSLIQAADIERVSVARQMQLWAEGCMQNEVGRSSWREYRCVGETAENTRMLTVIIRRERWGVTHTHRGLQLLAGFREPC